MTTTTRLADAGALPFWRRPQALLFLMAAAMPVAFATWSALLNNFVIEVANFDGHDIGWLHTVREIPGFLAIGVIIVIRYMHEQVLALLSLALLGVATAVTAWFPTLGGIMVITLLSSIGFHYYETVNQSLQLQWFTREEAPRKLGLLLSVGSAATLASYGLIVLLWEPLSLTYNAVYLAAGGFTALVAIFAFFAYPRFEAPNPQLKSFVLRRRYWLYYLLQFMAGARRQIFVVFAGFMMVERFGYDVHQVTGLFLVTLLCNMIFAPLIGRAVQVFGERRALLFEYAGLVTVFTLYGGIYFFSWGRRGGRHALRDRQPALRHGAGAEDLFPEDRRSGRHRADRGGGLHDQPHRGGLPACGARLSLAGLAGDGLRPGGGHGLGFVPAGAADPAPPGAGP
jgi:hypothetical protein